MPEKRYTAIKRTAYCPVCGKKNEDAHQTVDRPPDYGVEIIILCDCGHTSFSTIYNHDALMKD